MIFVTVGTHEQAFDRLVEYVDTLKKCGEITEEVIIQTGYSTYEPKYCQFKKLFPYQEMQQLIAKARIVVTHGGPSSFLAPLQLGKIPVVVPRLKSFDEHVNNHQLEFARAVEQRQKNIIVVEKIEDLKDVLQNYDKLISSMKVSHNSNNESFNRQFKELVNDFIK
jgi:UDP-N-acetylglucosamine transferase subunit ALG13